MISPFSLVVNPAQHVLWEELIVRVIGDVNGFASDGSSWNECFGLIPGSRDILLVEIVAETVGTDVTES